LYAGKSLNSSKTALSSQLSKLRFPAQYLGIVESFAEQRGTATDGFHQALSLPAGHTGHRDNALDGEQFLRLMQYAQSCADPNLPLSAQLLEHAPLTAHGTLGIVILTSPNLSAALDAAVRFYPLVMPACDIQRADCGDFLHLDMQLRYDFGTLQEALTEMLLGAFSSIRQHLPPTRDLLAMHFSHAARYPLEAYSRFAEPSALHFNQPCNRVVIHQAHLGLSLMTSSRATMRQFEQQLETQISALREQPGFSRTIRERLQAWVAQGKSLGVEVMAESLHMSSRTLGRRLAQEGQIYKALVNEVRLDHAETLLLSSQKSVSQIARLTGFTNDSSFARAFRKRKGLSPVELRQQNAVQR
jgi:AraC-like DNA-binding protein